VPYLIRFKIFYFCFFYFIYSSWYKWSISS